MSIYGQLIKGMRYVAPKAFKGVVDKVRSTISPSRSVFMKDIDMHIEEAATHGLKHLNRKGVAQALSDTGSDIGRYGKKFTHEEIMPRSDAYARDKIKKELLSDESFNKFMANAEDGFKQENAQLLKIKAMVAEGDEDAYDHLIKLYQRNMANRFTFAPHNIKGIPNDGIWGDLHKYGKKPGKSPDIGEYIQDKLEMISERAGDSYEKFADLLYNSIVKNARKSLAPESRKTMRKLYNARVELGLKQLKSKVRGYDDGLAYHKAGMHDQPSRMGVDVGKIEAYKEGAEVAVHEMKHGAQSTVAGKMFPSMIFPEGTALGGGSKYNLVSRGADTLSLPHRGKAALDQGRGIQKSYWDDRDPFQPDWNQMPWEKSAVMSEYRQMSPFEKNILKKYMNANSEAARKIYEQTIKTLGLTNVETQISRMMKMWKPAGGDKTFTYKNILKNFLDKESKMWSTAPGLLGLSASKLTEKDS